ncbi:hypothetical protein [Pseudomonas aeruginosa]|uniref:DUF7364 domain-containing protein n=3 Tax=Pseudomonas aeruginosa TaxID=287 RepID=UPI001EE0EF1A|nr:hypothetical protein [Pseudomonas aeruginosa]
MTIDWSMLKSPEDQQVEQREAIRAQRRQAYRTESDPLRLEAEFDAITRQRLRAELLEVGFLNQCCLDLMESMEAEFSLTKDQRECIEQLSQFLREGIGKLTALSERVADGDIVVLC